MKNWLRVIGGANILWGSVSLVRTFWQLLTLGGPALLRHFGWVRHQVRLPEYILLALITLAIPAARVATGWGIVRLKEWAVRYTVLTVLVDCLINYFGAIYFCILCVLLGNVDIPIVVGKGVHAESAGMLPVYIAALVDLLFLSILARYEEDQ